MRHCDVSLISGSSVFVGRSERGVFGGVCRPGRAGTEDVPPAGQGASTSGYLLHVLLERFPPQPVGAVPTRRFVQALEQGHLGSVAEFGDGLAAVEGVTQVVAFPVLYETYAGPVLTMKVEQSPGQFEVGEFIGTADVVDLALPPAAAHQGDAVTVVVHVGPLARVAPVSVQRQRLVAEQSRAEAGAQFFRE